MVSNEGETKMLYGLQFVQDKDFVSEDKIKIYMIRTVHHDDDIWDIHTRRTIWTDEEHKAEDLKWVAEKDCFEYNLYFNSKFSEAEAVYLEDPSEVIKKAIENIQTTSEQEEKEYTEALDTFNWKWEYESSRAGYDEGRKKETELYRNAKTVIRLKQFFRFRKWNS